MTEAEWLASDDPAAMLGLFAPSLVQVPSVGSHETPARFAISDRKLRLFAVACCRAVWHLLADDVPCFSCKGTGCIKYSGRVIPVVYGRTGLTEMKERCLDCGGTGSINRSRNAVLVAERYADGLATNVEAETAYRVSCHTAAQLAGRGDEIARAAWAVANGTATDRDLSSSVYFVLSYLPLHAPEFAALLHEIVGNPFRPVTLPWAADVREYDHYQTAATMSPGPVRAVMYSCPWLTADVRAIATAAYEERPGGVCGWCEGTGQDRPAPGDPWPLAVVPVCRRCKGTRRNGDGTFDNVRLAVLADALEEAGCAGGWGTVMVRQTPRSVGHIEHRYTTHPLVEHLRSPGPHVRGCWALDLILGKN